MSVMEKTVKSEFVIDLAEFLVDHGFSSKKAYELSKKFWDKNWSKLKKELGL